MDLLWALLRDWLWKVNSSSDFFFFILWVIYVVWLFYIGLKKLYAFLLGWTIWLLVFIALYYLLPEENLILWFTKEVVLQISIYFVILFGILIQKNQTILEMWSCCNNLSRIFVFIIAILFIPAVVIWLIEREWIFDIPNVFHWLYYMPFWKDLVSNSWIYWFFLTNVQIITVLWIVTSLFFMFFNKIFAWIWAKLWWTCVID